MTHRVHYGIVPPEPKPNGSEGDIFRYPVDDQRATHLLQAPLSKRLNDTHEPTGEATPIVLTSFGSAR